ncbi:MAG: hypothetical protein GY947_20235 [Rhodobacteraceae bacterium]|nr:hypothetical protein [Paracoccaceae bacterium]
MPQNQAQTAEQPAQSGTDAPNLAEASPIELLSAWNAEISRFYLRRYQQCWKLPLRMQSLLTQNDFRGLQSDFFAELLEDYRNEALELSQIMSTNSERKASASESDYAASLLKAQEDAAAIIDQAKAQAEKILASAHKRAQTAEQTPSAKQTRKTA